MLSLGTFQSEFFEFVSFYQQSAFILIVDYFQVFALTWMYLQSYYFYFRLFLLKN